MRTLHRVLAVVGRSRNRVVPAIAVLFLWGCGDNQPASTSVPEVPEVTSIEVSLGATDLPLGDTTTATAVVYDQNGKVMPDVVVVWSSDDTTRATVSSDGLVTGLGEGAVSIVGTSSSVSDNVGLTVTPALVADVEGQTYGVVRIGDQLWTRENLAVQRYNNGDLIPRAESRDAWRAAREAGEGAWAYYDNDPSHAEAYGLLYNQYAVADDRGLCPEGWHVATDEGWQALERHIGMSEAQVEFQLWRGTGAGKIKATRAAPDPHPRWDEDPEATNETLFSALPGGYRVGKPLVDSQTEGEFLQLGGEAPFWSSTKSALFGESHWARSLVPDRESIYRRGDPDGFGFAVRCVKN